MAFEKDVVRRTLICVAIVGAVLIGINHGDAILCGDPSTAVDMFGSPCNS